MRRVEFTLTDEQYRAANLAAASCNGMTANQLAKAVLTTAAMTMAQNDPNLARMIESAPAKVPAL